MGFAISWVAFEGIDEEEAARRLGFVHTGAAEEVPDFDFASTCTETGWSVIWYNEFIDGLADDRALLGEAAKGCDLAVAQIEEHVMYCRAGFWSAGREVWSAIHDANVGPMHIETRRSLPASYDAILRTAAEQQDGEAEDDPMSVDFFFEVPLDLVEGITGFRHDMSGGEYRELKRIAPSNPPAGFFRRLFGR